MKRIISLFCLCLLSALSACQSTVQTEGVPKFDGAALLELIVPAKTDNPERGDKLLNYARHFYETRVKGLGKLRAALPGGADRRFLEDWLFFEQCRFVAYFLDVGKRNLDEGDDNSFIKRVVDLEDEITRQTVQKNLRNMQDFTARLLQEKVDFVLEGLQKNPNLDAVLLQKPEDEPCVGDPCGHPTEWFVLSDYYESAQEDITDEKGREKLRAILGNGANYGYQAYLYQRHDVKFTLETLQTLSGAAARAAAARLAVFTRDGLPKQRLEGLEQQFFSRYLQELYEAKYYIALYNYDGKTTKVNLAKFPGGDWPPGICTKHPEFLRPEIAKKCREGGRGGME